MEAERKQKGEKEGALKERIPDDASEQAEI